MPFENDIHENTFLEGSIRVAVGKPQPPFYCVD